MVNGRDCVLTDVTFTDLRMNMYIFLYIGLFRNVLNTGGFFTACWESCTILRAWVYEFDVMLCCVYLVRGI